MPFRKKTEPQIVTINPLEDVPVSTLRSAEDASEIAYALARILQGAGHSQSYVDQIRTGAHAVIELSALHSAHSDKHEEDSSLSAGEHTSEIRRTLSKRTYQRAQLSEEERNLIIRALQELSAHSTDQDSTDQARDLVERLKKYNLQFWPRRDDVLDYHEFRH